MGLLGWFRRRTPDLAAENASEHLIQEATDYVIRMTDPRLALLPRCRDKLAPAVAASLAFLQRQRPLLPEAHPLSASLWATTACLRAMFVSARDIDGLLGRSAELRAFFARQPLLEEAHAIMGMAVREQEVLGLALQGEMVQRDVAQTTLGFSEHRIRLFGESPQALWRAVARRLVDELAMIALTRINAERDKRKSLETDTALLRARLRTFERRGTGVDAMLDASPASATDTRKLLHQLERNERQLHAMGGSDTQLERELEVLHEVFADPARLIEVAARRLYVDDMNRVRPGDDRNGTPIEYVLVRVRRTGTVAERAFLPVRVSRHLPQETGLRLDEASALLG